MTYFRQLCDCASRTYTYLIADQAAGSAALIDPVLGEILLYLIILKERQLHLTWVQETHLHADHITTAAVPRRHEGARIEVGRDSSPDGADAYVADKATCR